MLKKTAKELWGDYHFLTKEMIKFLDKKDMDIFYDLMNQRERLQVMIDQVDDDGFKISTEGQELLAAIRMDSQLIIHTLQFQINIGKKQHQVAEAYGGETGQSISSMTWKR